MRMRAIAAIVYNYESPEAKQEYNLGLSVFKHRVYKYKYYSSCMINK